jgi:hypothetical protein
MATAVRPSRQLLLAPPSARRQQSDAVFGRRERSPEDNDPTVTVVGVAVCGGLFLNLAEHLGRQPTGTALSTVYVLLGQSHGRIAGPGRIRSMGKTRDIRAAVEAGLDFDPRVEARDITVRT